MSMFAGGKRLCWAALIGLAGACGVPVQAQAVTTVDATARVQGAAAQAGSQANSPAAQQARWQLRRGVPVHTQLQGWAAQSDWTLTWQPRVSWLVAADVAFDGGFEDALKAVIEGLFFEGKPVRLVLWQGNHLAEVVSSDAR